MESTDGKEVHRATVFEYLFLLRIEYGTITQHHGDVNIGRYGLFSTTQPQNSLAFLIGSVAKGCKRWGRTYDFTHNGPICDEVDSNLFQKASKIRSLLPLPLNGMDNPF